MLMNLKRHFLQDQDQDQDMQFGQDRHGLDQTACLGLDLDQDSRFSTMPRPRPRYFLSRPKQLIFFFKCQDRDQDIFAKTEAEAKTLFSMTFKTIPRQIYHSV